MQRQILFKCPRTGMNVQLSLDENIPENKGKKEFMVDYDWHLPLAYVWLNPQQDADVPLLSAQVCMKGKIAAGTVESALFFNGKQISTDRVLSLCNAGSVPAET